MLSVQDLHVSYGAIKAVLGISFDIDEGEIVTLIGANGAGKSTTLNTIAGLIKPDSGSIDFRGEALVGTKPHKIVSKGLALCPEGRRIFPELNVEENLKLGAYRRGSDPNVDEAILVYPEIEEFLTQNKGDHSTIDEGFARLAAILRMDYTAEQ